MAALAATGSNSQIWAFYQRSSPTAKTIAAIVASMRKLIAIANAKTKHRN